MDVLRRKSRTATEEEVQTAVQAVIATLAEKADVTVVDALKNKH